MKPRSQTGGGVDALDALAERNKSRRSQTSLRAFESTLQRGLFRGRVPTGKPTFQLRAHPADVDQPSASTKAADCCSGCVHLSNSAIFGVPDPDGERTLPRKHLPTIHTEFAVYLFIPQEVTTGSSASSHEPRSVATKVSKEALAAMVRVR